MKQRWPDTLVSGQAAQQAAPRPMQRMQAGDGAAAGSKRKSDEDEGGRRKQARQEPLQGRPRRRRDGPPRTRAAV